MKHFLTQNKRTLLMWALVTTGSYLAFGNTGLGVTLIFLAICQTL